MNSTPISPWFWTSDTALWNYGDALSVFLVNELIYDIFPYSATTHIIGSVIFDGILGQSDLNPQAYGKALYDDREVKSVFWGCGIRNPGSLDPTLHSSVEFLAVRGPVSASDLRLGGTIPQGDPALLLPALYSPRKSKKFSGKIICVPHYNDERTDEDIKKASGCELVLRPAVKKNQESIKAFIDAICSAKFVLAGAMHAAVTAAAYGVPFGFWNSGAIDIPTKWEDTAGLLSIPCAFFETADAAAEFYDREIASAIVVPSLWPLICVAPGFLKGAGMLKVLKYELERSSGKNFDEIGYFIEDMAMRNAHHERIATLSHEIIDEYSKVKSNILSLERSCQVSLDEKQSELNALKSAHDLLLNNAAVSNERISDLSNDIAEFEQRILIQHQLLEQSQAETRYAIEAHDASRGVVDAMSRELEALQSTLDDRKNLIQRLSEEISQKDDEVAGQAEANGRLVEDMRADHDQQIAEQSKIRQQLQGELAQLREAIGVSQDKLEEASSNRNELRDKVAEVTARLEQVEADAFHYREEAEKKSRDELGKLDQERIGLRLEKERLEGVVDAIQDRLEAANHEVERQTDIRNASEERAALLETKNQRLKRISQDLALERNELQHLMDEHSGLMDALKLEVQALSSILEEQRRQGDRKVQNLAMEHEEQMLAQHETYRALEADMARVQKEMLHLIRQGDERKQQADTQFESVRSALQHEVARLSEEYTLSNAKNANLEQELGLLCAKLNAADADAGHRIRQIEELNAEIQHLKAQTETLRHQSQALVAQQVGLRDSLSLAESEGAAKVARSNAALSRYWQLLGQNSAQLKDPSALVKLSKMNKKFKLMREHRDVIAQFIDKFTEAELAYSKSGRKQRITQYLLGVTSDIEDFPLFNRDVYLLLNPDVADASVEPFIHFIENGQWESRIIHPLMDIPYYVSKFPEVDKFKISAVEHYFKYGVSKGYDPSPLFDTKWYFQHYADVKLIGINPVIHYLRHPGCQPHPDFESDYYRKHNLDVVRQGTNPAVHYALWGRNEGRRPKLQVHAPVAAGAPELLSSTSDKQPLLASNAPSASAPSREDVDTQVHTPTPSSDSSRRLVVMMDAFYPRPDEDSGSLDQVNFIRIFQNLGHDVAFIGLLNFGDAPEVGAKISALGAHCITSSEFSSIEEYLFLNQERISTIFLSRVHFGGAWIERAKAFCPKARILFNTVDLHHIREEREAVLRGDADSIKRAEETKRLEYSCIMAADASIVVSDHEQKLLADELPSARVVVVPLMRDIPRTTFPAWHDRQHLAFIGGFQHQPNVDAVNYFLDEIWPIVQARRPDLIFHVIGSHLTDELKARHEPNVEWIGYVPEIEPWLDRLRLTVAPLRYGAGAKGKVVSSLLNGVPCVATSVAAEGMGLRIGDDIVACPNPESFADAILQVHDDIEVWTRLSTNGFDAISRTYSIEYAQKCLEAVL